jgi:hypothetical protein
MTRFLGLFLRQLTLTCRAPSKRMQTLDFFLLQLESWKVEQVGAGSFFVLIPEPHLETLTVGPL